MAKQLWPVEVTLFIEADSDEQAEEIAHKRLEEAQEATWNYTPTQPAKTVLAWVGDPVKPDRV